MIRIMRRCSRAPRGAEYIHQLALVNVRRHYSASRACQRFYVGMQRAAADAYHGATLMTSLPTTCPAALRSNAAATSAKLNERSITERSPPRDAICASCA